MKYWNRIFIGLLLLGLAYLTNFAGPITWSILILVVCFLAYSEFKNLCNNIGVYPVDYLIYTFISLFVLSPIIIFHKYESPLVVFVFDFSLILASYVIIFPRILLKTTYTKFEDLTMSLWAIIHLGMLGSFFTWLRMMDNGFYYILALVMTVAASDTGSLLFGKIFGGIKLAPKVSPGKTIAGSIGGIFCGALIFSLSFFIFNFRIEDTVLKFFSSQILLDNGEFYFKILFTSFLGALVSIVSQIGDLLVSALKRAAGVKDSGNLLLSHGGVLDRIDGIVFSSWFVFLIFAFLVH